MHRAFPTAVILVVLLAGCGGKTAEQPFEVAPEGSTALREQEDRVTFPGQCVSRDIRILDLSGLTREDVEAATEKLPLLRNLERVELMDGAGRSELEPEDVYRLQCSAPWVQFHYCFPLFGEIVSTTDEVVEITADTGEEHYEHQIRQALDILTNCHTFRLNRLPVDNRVMAGIREDYRGRTKVVWRVYFANRGSCMTDRKVIRYVYNLDDSNCGGLAYCEDAQYVDFGHNETLSDCSWASGMPKLKAVILSGSSIYDLSPFSGCRELEFLEIAYCAKVTDLSPLRDCRKLQMVNTSYTGVRDFSPLDETRLQQLCSVCSGVSRKEQERFSRVHPDCLARFWGKQPYGYGWRYERDGVTPTAYYAKLKEIFHYPDTHDTTW